MASIIRVGIGRFLNGNGTRTILLANKDVNLVRHISSKSTRLIDPDRKELPKPWPYNEKRFNFIHYWYDKTTARLDDNSKIVVVEGPVAAGKTKFAKQLACELDMLYLPEANLDMYYINNYGFDLRSLDPQLPESCRSFDIPDFLRNPNHRHSARFQIWQHTIKYSQYIDALAHVLSTGQGVVLDRCVYSDFIFAECMFSAGYLSKAAKKKYYEYRDCTIGELLRPHLIIYLDVPVPRVMENIKKRNIDVEVNSPVLTAKYLGEMEKRYKQDYLKEMNKHAELLVYDWSEEGEVEVVIEDIERINFNAYDSHDTKMKDWIYQLEEEYACLRYKYADNKDFLLNYVNIPAYEVPEVLISAEDSKIYHEIMNATPGETFMEGYNSSLGDTGMLFKVHRPKRDTLPLRQRRAPFN